MIALPYIGRLIVRMRWRAGLAVLLLGMNGALEGTGLLLLIPLLGAIGLDVHQGPLGPLAALVAEVFTRFGLTPSLRSILFVFLAVSVASALLRRAQSLLSATIEQEVVRQATEGLYGAVMHMNWLAFSRLRASDTTVALTSECDRLGMAASQLLSIAASAIVTSVYILLALRLSVPATLGVSGCGLALLFVLRHRTARATALGGAYADAAREMQGAISDDLTGMKTIRSFQAGDRSFARFAALATRVAHIRVKGATNYANATFWLDIGSVTVLAGLVFVTVDTLNFPPAALLVLLFLFGRIVPRLASLQQNIQFLAHILPSCQRVIDLHEHCQREADVARLKDRAHVLRQGSADASQFNAKAEGRASHIALKGVHLRYSPDAPEVLRDFNLTINAGTTVALVGGSGAGKTTAADVLMGLLKPEAGEVRVDGRPLAPAEAEAWREAVAYVPQDAFLFHDTVRANLLWAVPTATEDAMHEALTLAAAGFVRTMADGLDTIVGDRGIRLSGGERQRLALARALLRRPLLLVLDEATSAIDAEHERQFFDTVGRLHGSMTILLITHRLAAVVDADSIHVLEDGRVVESGSWAELMARQTRFRTLWNAQLGLAARETQGTAS